MARKKRYLLRDSDRSGFTYKDIELVNDDGHLVGPDEIDAPPPSNKIYKDEGGVSPDEYLRGAWDTYTTPEANDRATQVIGCADQVTLAFDQDNSNFQIKNPLALFYIAGASSTTVLTQSVQVPPSDHGDMITVECVSNNIVFMSGSGISLYTSIYNMTSGDILNLIYNATDGLWQEASRGRAFGNSLGEF